MIYPETNAAHVYDEMVGHPESAFPPPRTPETRIPEPTSHSSERDR
jgi:hypothetical protein